MVTTRSFPFLLILLVGFIPGCVPGTAPYTKLEPRTVRVAAAQSILIEVDYGEVSILPAEDDRATVQGEVLSAEEIEYRIDSTRDQVRITVLSHRNRVSPVPLRVILHLPQQVLVEVRTEGASVLVRDLQGSVEVASTSGSITLEHVTGRMTLRSNRGGITVGESSGNISAVGNYGALTAENVRGKTAFSTIMGNVAFRGPVRTDDNVHIETDHGSVSVRLSNDSALSVQVRSTSGDVACMLPGLASDIRSCDGEFGSGGGRLSIRTVSGAVTLQVMP